MPKHEIKHPAGSPVSNELKELLLRFFKTDDVTKLERLGGRILISLAAPYVSNESRKRTAVEIGDAFIKRLRELRNDPEELQIQLDQLSVKQLRQLAKFMDSPVRTKSARQTIISELITHFHSEEIWKRISELKPEQTNVLESQA